MRSILLLAGLATTAIAGAAEMTCTPSVKYDCSATACSRTDEGFQHAESFSWNAKSKRLEACLWTSCYRGTATVLPGSPPIMVGSLASEHPGGGAIAVTLSIGGDGKFTATYGQNGDALTLDVGTCRDADSSKR